MIWLYGRYESHLLSSRYCVHVIKMRLGEVCGQSVVAQPVAMLQRLIVS